MSKYIWEKKEWPAFYWDKATVASIEYETFYNEGFLEGLLSNFENEFKMKHHADTISTEIERSWKIENEDLDSLSVYSSVC
ncbi:MAG: DUF4172 domain-containing protein, partial [Spirochaetaceae bacterium]|nr:DUF4172 domain-containing protein [Spirochaetaceae bacterium]